MSTSLLPSTEWLASAALKLYALESEHHMRSGRRDAGESFAMSERMQDAISEAWDLWTLAAESIREEREAMSRAVPVARPVATPRDPMPGYREVE